MGLPVSVTLEPYQHAHLPQLQELVNSHLSTAVAGWVLPGRFIHDRLRHHPEQHVIDPWVSERVTLCAMQAGRVVAAAHLLYYGNSSEIVPHYRGGADIAWLLALPAATDACDLLLEEALYYTQVWNASRVTAFDSGLPVPALVGIPDVWPHIHDLFMRHGFRPDPKHAEALYSGLLEPTPNRSPPLEGLRIEQHLGQADMWFRLYRGDERLAHCECIPDLTNGGELASLRTWAVLSELEVGEPWRGQGLGTYLVGHAVAWLRLAGCERVVIPVAGDDEVRGAGRFYGRFGWDVLVREKDAWIKVQT